MEETININRRVIDKCLEGDIKAQFQLYKQYSKAMHTRIKIKEGSELQMKAIKGTESEGMASFFINGYDMAVILNEH